MDSAQQGWEQQCREAGVDPAEVRLVLGRYDAYRQYYQKAARASPLPIETWFRWYRVEVATETGQQAPPPGGCSVDDEAKHRGAIGNPAAFLRMLVALDACRTTPAATAAH